MLLGSTGDQQNHMNTARRMRPRIPMISPLASRRRRLERRRIRLLAMLAVIPTTPPPPPRMELPIRATRPHPLHPGLSPRTHTHPRTSNPVDGNTPPRLATLLTLRRPQIPMDDRRLLPRPSTLLQGILVTMTNPIWSIAKPPSSTPAAAPGYYIASDGRRKLSILSLPTSPTTDTHPSHRISIIATATVVAQSTLWHL